MKTFTIILALTLFSTLTFASEDCRPVSQLRGYDVCVKDIQRTNDLIILGNIKLERLYIKKNKLVSERICKAFGGEFKSHIISTVKTTMWGKWKEKSQDIEVTHTFGPRPYNKARVLTGLTCIPTEDTFQ